MKNLGNIIYVDDLLLGGLYLPEGALLLPEDALTPTGDLLPGIVKLESVTTFMYAPTAQLIDKLSVVCETESEWQQRNPEPPFELITDQEPEHYGNLVTLYLNHMTYDFTGDDVKKVYFK